MFTPPLNLLFFFMITTPIVGLIELKIQFRKLCGTYVAVGFASSLLLLYKTFTQISSATNPLSFYGSPLEAYLKIDSLSMFMAFTAVSLAFLINVYSLKYMERDSGLPLYYTMLVAMVCGILGVFFAGDLFTLFIFWELMCISSYVLVSFRKHMWEPVEAGIKYLIMSSAGSATLLLGMSMLYGLTGTLNFEGFTSALSGVKPDGWIYLMSLLILAGFGVKAAIVPLHTWLPDAYSAAPSPISAILSGIVTETGIYALSRMFFTAFIPVQIEWSTILAFLSVITMTLGNVTALFQNDLKRLLAYSSIAHIGYMLIGLSVGTQLALTGTILHIFNHALMKGAAFLCAGAIIYRLGARRLDEITGIGRRMPITATALGISLLALTGMPPLNGFVSELILFMSTAQANVIWLGIALVLNSILSTGYCLRVISAIAKSSSSEGVKKAREAPLLLTLPICIMSALVVLFGVWPDPVLELARRASLALLSIVRG